MGTALVTGVTGQLGYFVAEQLAKRGDTVWGLVRQSTIGRGANDRELPYQPVTGDLLDEYSLLSILEEVRPDRIFNFGAQSFIPASWTQPILTAQYTGLGVVRLLEAVRRAVPGCRVLQAGSSELFAGAETLAAGRRRADPAAQPVRDRQGVRLPHGAGLPGPVRQFASNAVFFTNESRRRSPEFVFRKVTRGVAEIVAGKTDHLSLGNLETVRDWGYAPEYAALSIALLDCETPDDFVIATGEGHTVRELVTKAFGLVGLDWEKYVRVDTTLVRRSEQVPIVGNSAKLKRAIGREPRVRFESVLKILLAHDLRQLGCEVPFASPGSERLARAEPKPERGYRRGRAVGARDGWRRATFWARSSASPRCSQKISAAISMSRSISLRPSDQPSSRIRSVALAARDGERYRNSGVAALVVRRSVIERRDGGLRRPREARSAS